MSYDTRSLRTKGSTETLMSLLQLDPAPMPDNASIYEKDLPPLPEETESPEPTTTRSSTHASSKSTSSAASATSLGLSGGGRGPIFYLMRIQRYSSYAFSLFAGLHITNTSIIPLVYRSVPYSEPYLLMARELYQTPVGEPLLVAIPAVAHVVSGLAIRLLRRRQNLRRYGGATPAVVPQRHASKTSFAAAAAGPGPETPSPWPPMYALNVSGYVLTLAVAAHVAANRVLPLAVEGDSSNIGLAYVAHGFADHPLTSWAAYAVLLAFGAGHMVWGWARWLDLAPPRGWARTTVDRPLRRRRRKVWLSIQAAAIAVAGLWAAGGLGVVARAGRAEGWIGGVYDAIYEKAFGRVYDALYKHAYGPVSELVRKYARL
ncbi:DUF1691-domain-containing protein [Xylariomycetidae sp. FL0641]|nr:DUF1691-domain-containing protein [Xylariomycetidae sp. FL0641]